MTYIITDYTFNSNHDIIIFSTDIGIYIGSGTFCTCDNNTISNNTGFSVSGIFVLVFWDLVYLIIVKSPVIMSKVLG